MEYSVDRNQLENAILNLAINARDALQRDGTIRIQAENVVLSSYYCARKDIVGGDYLQISVADTGTDMTPEVLSRAFEPLFTTKPEGHGTGLVLRGGFKKTKWIAGAYSSRLGKQ